MTHGSLFAGVEGFGLGFRNAGMRTIWQVEKETFCQAVLRSRFPGCELFDDVKTVGAVNLKPVDVITAGVPCQDVSVAGKRAGLAGERTGLFYEFARILRELRPAWFVFENVPGLLSSNRGRDFAEILRVLMVECGYGVCWRVLDSRYFGVAQRRRRVFIVGSFGKPCPAAVLFEPQSRAGNSETRQEARTHVAAPLTRGSGVTGNAPGRRREDDENLAACIDGSPYADREAEHTRLVAAPITASRGHHGHSSERGDGQDNLVATINSGGNSGGFRTEPGEHIVIQDARGQRDKRQNGIGISEGGPCYTLDRTSEHAVAYALRRDPHGIGQGHNTTYVSAAPDANGVRDVTGVSEGLDYPMLPKGLDSARYRALGNAVTASVAEWIGRRLVEAANQ